MNKSLGNHSAIEWVIDQYQVKRDKARQIISARNQATEPEHIVWLLGRVITVSLETVQIVAGLPGLG